MSGLDLDKVMEKVNETFDQLPDQRRGRTKYTMRDAASSAFSVFMMQSPSFLAHQRQLALRKGRHNVVNLFGAEAIPSDPQIRNLLDPVVPCYLFEPFWWLWEQMKATTHAHRFRGVGGYWLCTLDGTYYFGSQRIHCPGCSQRQLTNGETYYFHSMVTPVLVGPDHNQVWALPPEFITPQDGVEKQDSERAAAQRWIERHGSRLAAESAIILTDDLHCNQPFCALLQEHQLHFILVCKPDSHPALYEEVGLLAKLGAVESVREVHWNGQGHEERQYRFVNQVPLRGGEDALAVNWCEVTVTQQETGEQLYYNTFVTDLTIEAANVAQIVRSGRARWKVENENNNVLKNHGYHLEHNFGHGQQYLSAVLVTLNLLAFLVHTWLWLSNRLYQLLRQTLGSRRTFFADLRALLRYHCFASWHALFLFMAEGLELEWPEAARSSPAA